MAWNNIKSAKVRSALTVIGIVIGVMAVVALVSIGQGLQKAIDEQFKTVGSNRIVITPGGGGGAFTSTPVTSELSSARLYKHDADVISRVRGVEFAAGVLIKRARIEFDGKTKYLFTIAHPNDDKTTDFIKQIDLFKVEEGRYLTDADRYKAIIGADVATNVFDEEIRLRDKIKVEGIEFEVVGIHKKTGNPIHDRKITIPLEVAREIFNKPEEVSSIFATTEAGFEPSEVAEDIKKALRKDHGLKEGEEDFTVQTAEQMIQRFQDILGIVQIVLVGIAAISLLVGSTGIMSTMYTSVLERTREIGVMKAVGARDLDVMLIFLMEAGILGLVGGVVGTGIGLGISKVVEIVAASSGFDILKAYVSPELILGALAFSFGIGCVSGVLPARRAATMDPVESLRWSK
jgi:putative ABC transport system permease protein